MFEGGLISRRAFLKGGSLLLAGSTLPKSVSMLETRESIRIGMITDIHYADANPRGTRFYRDSLTKMTQAVDAMHQANADLFVELGDLIDSPSHTTKQIDYQNLYSINNEFSQFEHHRHYVLGNHCLTSLSKREFLSAIGRSWSHYSFNRNGFHFLVLDSCYRKDGMPYNSGNYDWQDADIPCHQAEWIGYDLRRNNLPTIVLAHHRLDVDPSSPYGVHSADRVRRVLEKSGDIVAVFQGHSHQNDYKEINGIHYVTLKAMVEGRGLSNNGWSIVHGYSDGTLKVEGFSGHHANAACGRRLGQGKTTFASVLSSLI